MRSLKFLLISVFFLLATACTNFNKIYKSGKVGTAAFYSEFPFITKLDLIFIPVEIRGKTYNFLFDTGAPNVISMELHKELELKSVGAGKVSDSQGNNDKLEVLKLDSVKVGGVYFLNTAAIVADLNQATELACLKIDGILGANLMKLAYWKIDSRNKKMTISSGMDTLHHDLTNGHKLPFRTKRTFTPIVELTINDDLIENITYDTGSGGYITFGKNMKITEKNFLAEYTGYGNTGLYGANRDTIRYGKIVVDQDGFSQIAAATYSTSTNKKLVGMEYLNQFVQILDWEMKEIILYQDEIKHQKMSSFPVLPRWVKDQLVIGSVRRDSITNESGLSVGDTISKFNGLNFQNADVSAYCNLLYLTDTIKPDTLILELINGKKYEFIRDTISLE